MAHPEPQPVPPSTSTNTVLHGQISSESDPLHIHTSTSAFPIDPSLPNPDPSSNSIGVSGQNSFPVQPSTTRQGQVPPPLSRFNLPDLPASDVAFDQIQADEVQLGQTRAPMEVPFVTTTPVEAIDPRLLPPASAAGSASGEGSVYHSSVGRGSGSGSNSSTTSPISPTGTTLTSNAPFGGQSGGGTGKGLGKGTRETLVPGYKQVEEFGPDEEYEDEEEEVVYVTFDLGSIEPTLIPSSSEYRVIGLDTPNPFLQLSGTILKGRHESLLGTELLFTEVKDDEDRSKRHLSFVSTTEQRVHFKEVQLVPKRSVSPSPTESSTTTNAKKNAKGKGKAKEVSEGEADTGMLDRMTGKDQPAKRARRKKEQEPKRRSTRKSKGKEKDDGGSPMDID
ncbi:hypothetical protein VKT23_009396 [Stygiomarasmius scandens]|uniref:Transcription factor TFIIIC triple barrel domain-containing protein n=1 Tax=Marasmiellus scandens TaxID=2682957 RepID=A0ABR1JKL1_9AGAR